MLLAVDVGNTHIRLGVFPPEGGDLERTWSMRTSPSVTSDELALTIRGLLGECAERITGLSAMSVVPSVTGELRRMAAAYWPGLPSVVVAPGVKTGVPLLVDNTNGRNLVQSAAILDYLADATGKFGGASAEERQQCREWMYWEFDRLAAPVFRMRGQRLGLRSIHQATAEMYVTEGNVALKVLDDHLKGRSWIVGNGATIADIDIYGVIDYAPAGGYDLGAYPNLSAWVARVRALPGFGTPDQILPRASRSA